MEYINAPKFGEITKIKKIKEIERKSKAYNSYMRDFTILLTIATIMNVLYHLSQWFQ